MSDRHQGVRRQADDELVASRRLARRVRLLRVDRGMGVTELARASGVSAATLCVLEAGRGNPTMGTLLAVARVLDVTPGDLLAPRPEPLESLEGPESPEPSEAPEAPGAPLTGPAAAE